ncbi:MAG: glycosyltransferase family 87 protein [Verrucomicrobiia bacterium]
MRERLEVVPVVTDEGAKAISDTRLMTMRDVASPPHNGFCGWARASVLFITALLVIGLGWVSVYRAAYSPDHRSDFTVYTAAGDAALTGADLYKAQNPRGLSYVYPPPFAILMVPFSVLPVSLGTLAWYALSVLLTFWSLRMCVTMVREERRFDGDTFWPTVLAAGLVLPWFIQGTAEGQATLLMSWLVVAALYWQTNNRPILGATCLAGAILVKVFPAVLLAYFMWRKKWRFVVATLVLVALGAIVPPAAVFGWNKTLTYWREWAAVVAAPSLGNEQQHRESPVNGQLHSPYKVRNQTLEAVCWRLTGARHARQIAVTTAIAMLVIIGLVGSRSQPQSESLIVSAVLVWMILAAPLSEFHYLLVLLLPMMAMVFVAIYEPDGATRWLARAMLAVYAVAGLLTLAFVPLQQIGLLCWTMIGLWGVLLTVVLRQARMSVRNDPCG